MKGLGCDSGPLPGDHPSLCLLPEGEQTKLLAVQATGRAPTEPVPAQDSAVPLLAPCRAAAAVRRSAGGVGVGTGLAGLVLRSQPHPLQVSSPVSPVGGKELLLGSTCLGHGLISTCH